MENARLTDDVERIRLENAHMHERNQTLEQDHLTDQEMIEDLKSKNESLQGLQDRFDQDQALIQELQDKCRLYEEEKTAQQQDQERIRMDFDLLTQEKTLLGDQLKQSDEKRKHIEEQFLNKSQQL